MRDVAFCTDAFASPNNTAYSERVLSALLWALVYANESWMVDLADQATGQVVSRNLPLLYQSGVFWEAEKPLGVSACPGGNGQERFLGVRQVIADGKADCEDLACWRVAELRLGKPGALRMGTPPRPGHPQAKIVPPPWPSEVAQGGVDAVPAFYSRRTGPRSWLYHIVVAWRLPDGGILLEDPSRQLGMGGRG